MLRTPQDHMVSLLDTASFEASVGPTSATGWTCAWVESLAAWPDLTAHETFLLIDETPPGFRLVLREGGGAVMTLVWPRRSVQPPAALVAAA